MSRSVVASLVAITLAAAVALADWKAPQQSQLTNRLLLVVDVSGSMRGAAIRRAQDAVLTAVSRETDDLHFGVITFGGTSLARWEGIPEEGVPEGWAALPSAIAVEQAYQFVTSFAGSGDTPVLPALCAALQERTGKLSIALLSDGCFPVLPVGPAMSTVAQLQESRRLDGRGYAVIQTYCVIPGESEFMTQLGERWGGGAFYVAAPLPEEDADDGAIKQIHPFPNPGILHGPPLPPIQGSVR